MDGWEAADLDADSDMIWACQSTALDHYERHPSSSNIQENIFESSLGKNARAVNANGHSGLDINLSNHIGATNVVGSGKLIDIDTSSSSSLDDVDEIEDEPKFRLLLRKIDGKKLILVDRQRRRDSEFKVTVDEDEYVMEKGSIVRELDENMDNKSIITLLTKSRGRSTPVASVDTKDAYGVVPESDLAKLSMEDVKMLRPVAVENRYLLYQDFARYAFVRDLKEGNEVEFKEESGDMRRGVISTRERDDRGDLVYSLRMDGQCHPQGTMSPPRERRNRYTFYDDYEGNEHEGRMIYRVTADRLFPPTSRADWSMDRERMRTPSPRREKRENLIPVRILDSPPAYEFVNRRDVEENRGGLYSNQSGEWARYPEDRTKTATSRSGRSGSPPQEKIIPIRILDSPPGNELVGAGDRRLENRPGPYRNLNTELHRYREDKRGPPPTKPRTKFDLPTQPISPSAAPTINRSRESEGTSGGVRTNGTDNKPRYGQAEDWDMNRNESRVNGGMRREEERDKRREVATATTRVEECEGWRVGYRCQWENDGKRNEATIRWMGRLRGHHSIYAGLEFDDPVGQGTGMYQGNELFTTRANHAGFVMLSTISPLLISTSSDVHPSSFHTQNQSRERGNAADNDSSSAFHHISYPVRDRVTNASPPIDVPISGQGAMIPPRHNHTQVPPSSSDGRSSVRDRPLPPPPFDAHTAIPSRPSPPCVPPRPAMVPEDYMIESFDVGCCVDVCHKGAVRSGVVRWKGDALNRELERLETSVIVELESSEAPPDGWRHSMETGIPGVDHTLSTVIVPLSSVRRDQRFTRDSSPLMGNGCITNGYEAERMRGQDFGSIDSGVETSKKDPWGGTEELLGRMKGIQGHRNSCYLDSMLYTLFVQCTAFDDILTRRRSEGDIAQYEELVRILSTEIVWPLRRFHYVRADHMMKLRRELEKALPSIKGLTSEEKDPEEILSSLLRDVFKTRPYLNLINAKNGKVESTWLYHVVVDADEWQGTVASSQHLLERSLRKDGTKLAECPHVLIMQLPRYGVTKLFDKIVPLEKIDLTPFINNTVFACAQCTKNPAELYCHECYLTREALYGEVSYCVECFRSVHLREGLADHADRPIPPPSRPSKKMTRYTFTLSGVLAIETSHYVSFVRTSHGRWLFFDSMADREGLQNGFNIPQVRECERVGPWLSLNGYHRLRMSPSSLPLDDPLVNRLLSDSYICIYTADQPTVTSSNSTTSLLSKLTKEFKISKN